MKIITYSDLHLEFGSGWSLPDHLQGDLMILAGDIIKLNDYAPLHQLLRKWNKPVLYVAGNHEYYTQTPMNREQEKFKAWLAAHHPLVNLLLDEAALIDILTKPKNALVKQYQKLLCYRYTTGLSTAEISAPCRQPARRSMIFA